MIDSWRAWGGKAEARRKLASQCLIKGYTQYSGIGCVFVREVDQLDRIGVPNAAQDHQPRAFRFWIPHIDLLWVAIVLLFVFVLVNTQTITPHDFWWHLKAGQLAVEAGQIPAIDLFSFTVPGKAYDNYAAFWVADSFLFMLYRWGGPPLVIFGHGAAITAAYALLLVVCKQASGSWRVAALATLFAVALGFPNWNVRPQGFAYLLAALLLWAFYAGACRPPRWRLALVPVTMLLWSNIHGSWSLGVVVLLAWYAGELWRSIRESGSIRAGLKGSLSQGFVVALGLMAVLVNPRGPRIVSYVVAMARDPASQTLGTEWVAPTFSQSVGAIFLVGLLLIAVLLAVSPQRPNLYQILIFLTFAFLGLRMIRGIIWFGFMMAPIVAEHLRAVLPDWVRSSRPMEGHRSSRPQLVTNYGLLLAMLLAGILSLPWLKGLLSLPPYRQGFLSPDTPVAAVDFLLHARPPGELFHEQGFGSYLIWAAYPAYRVFVDPRLELYPLATWKDYFDISAAAAGWQVKLDAYGVRTLLLSPGWQPALVRAAGASPEWQRVYADDTTVVFVRTNAE
jgi:hypothetical protein